MTTQSRDHDPMVPALVELLRGMRDSERDIFGSLDPDVRDRPMRPNDWSPKDHQAHLTAWKAIQAERIRAVAAGEELPTEQREDDEVNAELQAMRADWSWEAVVAEADEIGQRLEAAIRSAGAAVLQESDRLIGGIFGNGPFHAITHF